MNEAPVRRGPGSLRVDLVVQGRTAVGLGTTLRWRAGHRPDGMQGDATAFAGPWKACAARSMPQKQALGCRCPCGHHGAVTGESATWGRVPDRRPVARAGTTMGTVVEQPGSCPQKKKAASLYPLSGCSARGGTPTGLCAGQCVDPLGQKRLIHRQLPPLLLPLCFYKRNKEEDRDNRNLPGHRFSW